jgi:hypothetical protein
MQQEVLAQIVSLPETTLRVAGTVYNVNRAPHPANAAQALQ